VVAQDQRGADDRVQAVGFLFRRAAAPPRRRAAAPPRRQVFSAANVSGSSLSISDPS